MKVRGFGSGPKGDKEPVLKVQGFVFTHNAKSHGLWVGLAGATPPFTCGHLAFNRKVIYLFCFFKCINNLKKVAFS